MVRLVESVKPDITVLAAARVSVAVRVEDDRVDGAEVTLDAAELLFEDHVEEASVELPDSRGCCRHVHRLLAASEHDLQRDMDARVNLEHYFGTDSRGLARLTWSCVGDILALLTGLSVE